MRYTTNFLLPALLLVMLFESSATRASEDQTPIYLDAVVQIQNTEWKYTATGPHPKRFGTQTNPHRFVNDSNFTLSVKYVGSLDGADVYLVKYSASLRGETVIEETEKAVVYRGKELAIYQDEALSVTIIVNPAK